MPNTELSASDWMVYGVSTKVHPQMDYSFTWIAGQNSVPGFSEMLAFLSMGQVPGACPTAHRRDSWLCKTQKNPGSTPIALPKKLERQVQTEKKQGPNPELVSGPRIFSYSVSPVGWVSTQPVSVPEVRLHLGRRLGHRLGGLGRSSDGWGRAGES